MINLYILYRGSQQRNTDYLALIPVLVINNMRICGLQCKYGTLYLKRNYYNQC